MTKAKETAREREREKKKKLLLVYVSSFSGVSIVNGTRIKPSYNFFYLRTILIFVWLRAFSVDEIVEDVSAVKNL